MAFAEIQKLTVELGLKDDLSPGLGRSMGSVKRFDGALGKAGKGVRTFAGNLAKAGAVAGGAFVGGLALAVKTGIEDLASLETATTSVDGAIKQLGLTGQVTGKQVAGWANEIEANIGAAFDDKEITAATATLIRFGKVTPKNLKPAMVVMTDLAAKTGSVSSASSLLAKALADPAKAAGKLARAGLVLTKSQQEQIKALVKAGKSAQAQTLILNALSKSTKGAAAASQGPYKRALSVLADVSEDARKALAEGFLPVIEKVAGKLSKLLADPKTMKAIRDFGKNLAGGFDKLVSFAEKVPWGQVADGLGKAAGFAKTLFDVFANMPPEVQATLIGLAGLNKLSGGAITGIVSELGKGLIKGVLGMTAGVVNLKAGTVVGGGGAGVPGGAATGRAGKLLDGASKLLLVGFVAEMAQELDPVIQDFAMQIHKQLNLPDFKLPIPESWPWGPKNTPTILPEIFGGNGALGGTPDTGGRTNGGVVGRGSTPKSTGGSTGPGRGATDSQAQQLITLRALWNEAKKEHNTKLAATLSAKINGIINAEHSAKIRAAADAAALKTKQQQSLVAFRAGERATLGVKGVVSSKLGSANAKLDALRHKRTSFKTIVNVKTVSNVTVRDLNRKTTTSVRYNTRAINQAS